MTGSEDSHSATRPISVAELLARNGTIGAPPVGGRRRRRRGNSDAVTVAELTGEIPIVTDGALAETVQAPEVDEYVDVTGPLPSNGAAELAEADTDLEAGADVVEADTADADYSDAVADYTAHIEQRDAHPEPLDFTPRPRRPHYAHAQRRYHPSAGGGAEQMSPDPVIDDENEVVEAPVDLAESLETEDIETASAAEAADTADAGEPPSYLRSSEPPLFGGQTVADDLARRGGGLPEDVDLDYLEDDVETVRAPRSAMSTFVRGAWIVGQCIVAVAFGAGLFVAFDQLWKWNNIVALVLSVLVILGLVVGVRVVRKTEDIGSTLIAVAVGALVTLGPLALMQSG
ncbi:MAG: hypothetical protein ABWY20_06275 [Mycobacterium sp.]